MIIVITLSNIIIMLLLFFFTAGPCWRSPFSSREALCIFWRGSLWGPGCSSRGESWRTWLSSPWRNESKGWEVSWGSPGGSVRGRKFSASERKRKLWCKCEHGLTLSFFPLYGFLTNSIASTISSVMVRYLRTWGRKNSVSWGGDNYRPQRRIISVVYSVCVAWAAEINQDSIPITARLQQLVS